MKSILVAISAGVLLACASEKPAQTVNRDTLTQRQKDSILANSKILNARAVGSAMRAADSTSARVQRANALATDTSDH